MMQAEGAQTKSKRARSATKIMLEGIYMRQSILSSFSFRFNKYTWYIGTYHVYKKLKKPIDKLSYITDRLRKKLGPDSIIYVTKEYTEDRFPHYHFLVGSIKDEWGCSVGIPVIRNHTLWKREWIIGETFNYHSQQEIKTPKGYITYEKHFYVRSDLKILDMGAKQRWFKYGIQRYLLYIFKYSSFNLYSDYFIQNKKNKVSKV